MAVAVRSSQRGPVMKAATSQLGWRPPRAATVRPAIIPSRSLHFAMRPLAMLPFDRRWPRHCPSPVVTKAASTAEAPADSVPDVDSDEQSRSSAYPFAEIESKWQAYWEQNKTFRTPSQVDTSKPKAYVLDMFPYPSGAGLHVGHPEGYTATDIQARYKRMLGYNVLHPMGWDAFGLPAEQYALQTGTHPRVTTARNINRFRQQLKSLGFSYDWDRELSTTDPSYYKWTQWIFLQLHKAGLAYQAEVPVNWCPELGTVLANEEVIDGKSERGGYPVVRQPMKQWMLAITKYADRLLEDLEGLDWPDSIKEMQRNWIGRSEGADILFRILPGAGATVEKGTKLQVYTSRADTIFGVTYCVVAPEHVLLKSLASSCMRTSVQRYVEAAAQKSDIDRTELRKQFSGVFTGSYAVNPANGELVPIWVADYVLGSYGCGAIMAVPGHDERDYEFALQFGLPIRQVVAQEGGEYTPLSSRGSISNDDLLPYTAPGITCNSYDARGTRGSLNIDDMTSEEAREIATEWLEAKGAGSRKVNYKLRDWLFARQRYWGEPFPLIYPEGSSTAVALAESSLPLVLPDTDNFKPSGSPESPLASMKGWVNTVDPATGLPARRETSTMPQWAGSCWYYLRFIDPSNSERLVDPALEKYWMPVDLYVGGAEHAVLHLLYARFWHKVLYDLGVVSCKEPFQRLVSQGMILGEVEYTVWRDAQGKQVAENHTGAEGQRVAAEDVERKGDGYVLRADPSVRVLARAHKMSKSRGNVVNPDDVVSQFGADSLRLYEMFMGPLRDTKVWSTRNVEGVSRFLNRFWRLFEGGLTSQAPTAEQLRLVHLTIKKVTAETEAMRFNTAISALMEAVNGATKWSAPRPRAALEPLVLLLAPYAPHISEELWAAQLGHTESLTYEPWPACDESLLVQDRVKMAVQVNGKMRGTIEVAPNTERDAAVAAAFGEPNIQKHAGGPGRVKKVIYVPNKILNLIV